LSFSFLQSIEVLGIFSDIFTTYQSHRTVEESVTIPEFRIELDIVGASEPDQRQLNLRRMIAKGLVTEPFTGDEILTMQVRSFLASGLNSFSPQAFLTSLYLESKNNGAEVYNVVSAGQDNVTCIIVAQYAGDISFEGIGIPSSSDLGESIINMFNHASQREDFLMMIHSSQDSLLRKVSSVSATIVEANNTVGDQQQVKANGSDSILSGIVMGSIVCLVIAFSSVLFVKAKRRSNTNTAATIRFLGRGESG